MISLLLTNTLAEPLPKGYKNHQLIAMRKLKKNEIETARQCGINRYYLPTLNEKETESFYSEFEPFWDNVVKDFPKDHYFWRNIVSSKIQEWERSLTYLLLILFVLNQRIDEDINLVFIPGSVQEALVIKAWGQKYGWHIESGSNSATSTLSKIAEVTGNFLRFLRFAAIHLRRKALAPSWRPGNAGEGCTKKFLIASLFYPFSFNNGKYMDPFFKDLHNHLKKQGFYCQYVSDCLTAPSKEIQRNVQYCKEVDVMIPHGLISWVELLATVIRVFVRKLYFRNPVTFMGCDLTRLIQWNAHRYQFDFNTSSEIYYQAVSNITEKVKFDKLLVIYEGNVFERACIQAFRLHSGNQVNGYSHAVIFSLLSIKLHMSDKEKYLRPEPDYFVCSGERERNLLVNVGKRNPSRILTACALRVIPREQKSDQTTILVALDGMWSSVMLLDWLISHKDILDGYEVRVRAHPNVPLDGILSQSLHPLPKNFIASKNSLGEDISRSKCVIYRHTSVGMQAILNDIPAIHLQIDTPLKGDPIEELTEGKWTASNPEELKAALHEAVSLKEEQSLDMFKRAKVFADEYFSPPSEDRLKTFY